MNALEQLGRRGDKRTTVMTQDRVSVCRALCDCAPARRQRARFSLRPVHARIIIYVETGIDQIALISARPQPAFPGSRNFSVIFKAIRSFFVRLLISVSSFAKIFVFLRKFDHYLIRSLAISVSTF